LRRRPALHILSWIAAMAIDPSPRCLARPSKMSPSELSPIVVGPSKNQAAWREFFTARSWKSVDLARLMETDSPGAAFFEIETYINGMYRSLELRQALNLPLDRGVVEEIEAKATWLASNAEPFRRALGPRQRELDLGLMRWMRRASCLSVVIGAGATMDAGGPSWAELVRRLLVIALERGHEITEMRPDPESTPDSRSWSRTVVRTERLAPDAETRGRAILASIESGTADTEALMEGAQLCYDLTGQHLFTDITGILYSSAPEPGPVHRAIAELAPPIEVPDRGGWYPGWGAIITYNFDDLMGQALDEAGLARASFAMRGDELAGDPNPLAIERGQGGLYQGIYHLHGYTPRKPFLITHVRFVFSTSQYERTYGGARAGIFGEVFSRWLARPIQHALYVGCSFQDEAMNSLLRDAANALPGRSHYALLKWPGATPFAEASDDDVDLHSAEYHLMGVRPVWFERFDEVPDLIRALA
jgi:hypothetical protein